VHGRFADDVEVVVEPAEGVSDGVEGFALGEAPTGTNARHRGVDTG
jgi:hypothetical protein